MRDRSFPFLVLILFSLGLAACSPGGKPALDPKSADFFQGARLIMTGPEKDIFEHLPDAASREEFIADFWARRNPDPTSEVNEFRDEFERRVEYADKHFLEGRKGVDTDRGRIYVYLGPPDRVENFPFNRAPGGVAGAVASSQTIRGPILWWVYYRWELGIAFADFRDNGVFKMYEIEGNLLEAVEEAKLGAMVDTDVGRPMKFLVDYDRARKALVVHIPVKNIDFKEDGGRLSARFAFDVFLYKPGRSKERLTEERDFSGALDQVQALNELTFELPCDLPPGKSYADVILTRDGGAAKARRVFAVKN